MGMEPSPSAVESQEDGNKASDADIQELWLQAFRVLTLRRDILGIKILEKLYVSPAHPFVLDYLVRELHFITRSKSTVYYRLRRLHEMGLIDLIRSRPVVAWPKRELPSEVVGRLVISAARRLGVYYGRR